MLESVACSIDKLSLPYSLSGIRNLYFNGVIGFDTACSFIDLRRECSSYNVFSYNPNPDINFKKFIIAKRSFRGNDVYRARTYKKHTDLLNFCSINEDKSYIVPDGNNGFSCNIWKFTLTVNPDLFWNRDEFNKKCSHWYDIFIKRLRNRYPDIVVARSYEVSTKKNRGYFHVNVIAVFTDTSFPCVRHESKHKKDSSGNPVVTWRCKSYSDKKIIDSFWEAGFVDVQAIESPHELAEYSLKYYIKNFSKKSYRDTQNLTMSTLSLFNKRGFSFPRGSVKRGSDSFFNAVVDVTCSYSSEEIPVFFPRLDIINPNSLKCTFEGGFTDYNNDYDSKKWNTIQEYPPPEINYNVLPDFLPIVLYDSGAHCFNKSSLLNKKFTRQKKFKKGDFL